MKAVRLFRSIGTCLLFLVACSTNHPGVDERSDAADSHGGQGGAIAHPDSGQPDAIGEASSDRGLPETQPDVPVSLVAIHVDAPAPLRTTERGDQATFTVVLGAVPTADVDIALSSSNLDEGTVSPDQLTFTPVNWNAPQIVTVTGVDDSIKDGNIVYIIRLARAVSDDLRYAGIDPDDVTVTNIDDENPGLLVTASPHLTTSESGAQATFIVSLTAKPKGNVTVPLTSTDSSEGTVSPDQLVFGPDDWNAAKTVTLTGVDDFEADGEQPYIVEVGPTISGDPDFDHLRADDVPVVNIDNDTAGARVIADPGLTTNEGGKTATFAIVLNSKPTAAVIVPLSSTRESEGKVDPVSLTFTPDNWNAPQAATITGVDDDVADGNQPYAIVAGPAVSSDLRYNGMAISSVPVTNIDNDSAGITVASPGDRKTTEGGGQAHLLVVLNSKPLADVVIPVTSSDIGEATVSPSTLRFTAANWNAPQAVTITGVDDQIADGDQPFSIILLPASSDDLKYAGIDAPDLSFTNIDNDSAGITVSPTSGLVTTERGTAATFTIVLTSRPRADVTVAVSSSDATEGAVGPASVTFTSLNWNAPQTVTVTGADDAIADGNQPYTVLTAAATSADPGYAGLDAPDVSVTNTDNDSAGITITPTSGLVTTESGTAATFTIVLTSQPTADVNIGVASSDSAEGTVGPASVTFTSLNWNAPQTVTVTGVDDAIADGNQPYTILTAAATSADPSYAGLNPPDVSVSNTDNDSAGITVSPTSGLVTTETGGAATFTVVLTSQPTANVTIGVASSDLTEGTVGPASLTFTTVNWNAPQIVTVTGLDDAIADGNQPYTILTTAVASTDRSYAGIDPPDVAVTNTDNDSAGITVSPVSGLVTTEVGTAATFTIVLTSQPTADVTIGAASSDPSEGTVAPASVTFTTANWNAPQIVTVTGVDDAVADGNQPYTIVTAAAVSADPGYAGMDPPDVAVTNTDNDSAGITVSPVSGLVTTEVGTAATFTIVLTSQPTADVTIGVSSSDPSEGTVGPASVTFTAANWNAPQIVTVTGVDDAVADGNQPYTVITAAATSADPSYAGMDPRDVAVSNTDNDSAGITVSPVSGLVTTESGAAATFAIVLTSQPRADVTVGVASSDPSEGTVGPASMTFTTINWNAPQTVTVTGIDDAIADGNQPYTIVTAAAVSADPGYAGVNPPDVAVSNTDNDSAGITVSPTSGLVTTEAGGTATFTIVLTSEPRADVTIGVASSDPSEGTVDPASVTFTTLNWNAPQTVTVTGADDAFADGNQPYTIVTAAASSADPGYAGMNPPDVAVSNTDNDSAGITVTPTSGLVTTEAGGTATFAIVLTSRPRADVTIGVASNDVAEGTADAASVTFTTANWNAPQTITVTGADDAIADGNQPYTIILGAATSGDASYAGMNPPDVSGSNTDNDSAGITVTPTSGLVTTEAGGTAAFTIVLASQPTAEVTIGLASSDPAEGAADPASVTFTTANWNAPQIITVTGVDDSIADGNQPYKIIMGAATSADPSYAGRNPPDVSVSNTDNDSAGITVTPTGGLVTTEAGGTDTFTIVLTSQPAADVTIGVASNDALEGTVSPGAVTFTSVNWNAPQTVTVTGADDAVADGNQPFKIIMGAAVSADPSYAGRNPADVSVTNTDNDSAGITVSATSDLVTTEAGGTDTFTIVLTSQPTADVTIGVASNAPTEGVAAPAAVVFTTVNWNAPQTITVTGVDDAIADGNQPYRIILAAASSSDPGYAGRTSPDVSVSNTDNDSAGITVSPTSGLVTTEAGGTDTFTIVLTSQPTADVTIAVGSNNITEGIASPGSVTFTTLNWNAPQTVTVTGIDDAIADGNQPYTIIVGAAASADPSYAGRNPSDVSVTNTDNDSAGITVSPTSGLVTSESGDTVDFTIVLTSQPRADVTIPLASSNTREGTVNLPSVTFTTLNWNAPQTLAVTGLDDAIADGNQPYTIIVGVAASADPSYNGIDPPDVSLSNTDNDSAGITVTPTSGLVTTEAGGTATFTVILTSQPTANVTIGLASNDTTEGLLGVPSMTFTTLDWNTPQTVVVTGVDDAVADGNQPYTIVSGAAVSADPGYNGLNAPDVSVSNTDNDSAGITVTPTSGLVTTESGGTATFTIVLTSQPTTNVSIAVASNDTTEGNAAPASVMFTTGTWQTPQTITITGVADGITDGNQVYTIVLSAASSADPSYSGIDPPDPSVTNTDVGLPGFRGYANWSQNATIQSDAVQDAAMNTACAAAFPGSRAATMDELVMSGAVSGLPSTNTSGGIPLGKCPNCAGTVDAARVSGHRRLCWSGNVPWSSAPNPGCFSSTRKAVCVL